MASVMLAWPRGLTERAVGDTSVRVRLKNHCRADLFKRGMQSFRKLFCCKTNAVMDNRFKLVPGQQQRHDLEIRLAACFLASME
jgi:hypothetical protein